MPDHLREKHLPISTLFPTDNPLGLYVQPIHALLVIGKRIRPWFVPLGRSVKMDRIIFQPYN